MRSKTAKGIATVVLIGSGVLFAAAMFAQSFWPARSLTIGQMRLGHIGMALLLFELDHHHRYPDRLDQLLPALGGGPQLLQDPRSGGDFRFFAPSRNTADLKPNDLVAADPANTSQDGGNALFGDGHTEWLDAQTLQKTIDRVRLAAASGPSQSAISAGISKTN